MNQHSVIKFSFLASTVVFAALALSSNQSASASTIFDTFDEHGHSTTSSSISGGEISTISALGAPIGNGVRQIIASPGSSTVDTSAGGTFTGTGNYTQYRYGTWVSAVNELNLDLSIYDGFEFDVISVSGTATPAISLQFLSNGSANHFFVPNTSITGPGTYTFAWSDFINGSSSNPTASDLMDVDGVMSINNFLSGSGTLEIGELRLVPEPTSTLLIGAVAILGLFRRKLL